MMKIILLKIIIILVLTFTGYSENIAKPTKEVLIENILDAPGIIASIIRKSDFYNKEMTLCLNKDFSTANDMLDFAYDMIKIYRKNQHYIGLDTILKYKYNFYPDSLLINRVHIYFDQTDEGVRFDFVFYKDKWYLCTVDGILNKVKILKNSGEKMKFIEEIVNNPKDYNTIVENSKFTNHKYTKSLLERNKNDDIENLQKFKKSGYKIEKQIITWLVDLKGDIYPIQYTIIRSKDTDGIIFVIVFEKYDDNWYLTSNELSSDFISVLLQVEEENY